MKKRGKGISSMFYQVAIPNVRNPTGAHVHVNMDGTVQIVIGELEIGQGSNTILCQIAAEELGVAVENVGIIAGDTGFSPWGMASAGIRVTYAGGNAVRMAAAEAKKKLFEFVASKLVVTPDSLMAENGRIFVKGTPQLGVSLAEAAREIQWVQGMVVLGTAVFSPPMRPMSLDPESGQGVPACTYHWATQIAEVEVDTETGEVKVLKIVAAHDVGKAINPAFVEGQIIGGVYMGMGYGLMEDIIIDEKGKVLNPNLTDYVMPTTTDIPEIVPIIVEVNEPTGPYGAKGLGECTTQATAPAIANAIYDAIGVRINRLPITPDVILDGLKQKRGGKD